MRDSESQGPVPQSRESSGPAWEGTRRGRGSVLEPTRLAFRARAGCTGEGLPSLPMRFGFRRPSLRKRLAARTSWRRYVRHSLGLKAPRGWGWLTNPRRAAYSRVYSRTTRGCAVTVGFGLVVAAAAGLLGIA